MPRIRTCAVLLAVLAARSPAVRAHDIPNERVDRAIQVTLRPGRLEVAYEVSLAELTLVQDLRALGGPAPGADRVALYESYGRTTGPLNARGLLLTLDDRPLELRYESFELAIEEHPRYTFLLSVPLPDHGRLRLLDTNYASSEGTSRLALRARDGLVASGYDGPEDVAAVAARPLWQLSDEEERRTKEVAVAFRSLASPGPIAAVGPRRGGQAAPPRPAAGASAALTRLLDRRRGTSLLGLLVVAFGLGAAHAVQPGHGKTLVAAASVGERGGWLVGVLLALVTTIAHTGGVAALALALEWTGSTRYGTIHAALVGAAGFLIAAVGLWRLGRHLGGHGEHGTGVAESPPAADLGLRGLLGLGLAGGLVPCWDAVLLLVLAATLGRLPLGLALLAAFSAGMAAVLVVVGLLAGRVRALVTPTDRAGRWERRLGLASGLTLAVVGVAMLATA